MKRIVILLNLVWLLCLVALPATAQEIPIPEAEFWERMAQTERLLAAGLRAEDFTATLAQVAVLWGAQERVTVSLADGGTLQANISWLYAPTTSPIEYAQRLAWVRMLQDYQQQQLRAFDGVAAQARLDALEDVLRDPRYRYPDQEFPDLPDANAPLSLLQIIGQIVLTAGFIILIAVLFYYLAWNLGVQPADLPDSGDEDDIPATPQAADQRAAQALANGDYRAAIRYLYLSCLLMLDEHGVIQFDPTLTNYEHLAQLRGKPQLLEMLTPIVNVFDRVWYGFAPVDEPTFKAFQGRVEQLRQVKP